MSFGAVAALMALVPLHAAEGSNAVASTVLERCLRWRGQARGRVADHDLGGEPRDSAVLRPTTSRRLNPYGLVGNALALPLVSLVVMPSAVLGVLAYPFGLDRPVWQLMGAAVSQVLEVSAWVGSFSGSTLVVPALSIGALALLSLALLVLTIPASPLRWLAVLACRDAGLVFAAAPPRYDIFVDRDGAGAAIRSAGGRLALVGTSVRLRCRAMAARRWR